ncbi:hypothetical protein [Streptomyces sp. NPDC048737]|uniref:hypothetical protein n=1 Tax=unclassified Streptomyces TaxID=2593676 RepID=UPI0034479B62
MAVREGDARHVDLADGTHRHLPPRGVQEPDACPRPGAPGGRPLPGGGPTGSFFEDDGVIPW